MSPEFKVQLVMETIKESKSDSEIGRQYDVHPQLIGQWKRHFLKMAVKIFEHKREAKQKDQKVEELEKIIGKQTIEIQFLKKVLGHLD